jgi:hypothetical protein
MAFALDDQIQRDDRFRRLRLLPNFSDAFALYALFGSQCASERTDGRLFRGVARGLLPGSAKRQGDAAAALVAVGFLLEHESVDEYELVGFLELNESRARMQARREDTARRQRQFKGRKREHASPNASDNALPNAADNGRVTEPQFPVPSSHDLPSVDPPPKLNAGAVTAAVIRGFGANPGGTQIGRDQKLRLLELATRERPDDPLGALEDLGRSLRGTKASDPWLILVAKGFGAMVDPDPVAPSTPEQGRLVRAIADIDDGIRRGRYPDHVAQGAAREEQRRLREQLRADQPGAAA